MSELLEVRGLHVAQAHSGRTLVKDVSFQLAPGETVGIVGESGSGKSLTAKAIVGLQGEGLSVSGTILHRGTNVLGIPEASMRRLRGGAVSLVMQDPFTMLSPLRRCGTHIADSLQDIPRRRRQDEVVRRLAEVGIHDPTVARQYPFQLSGGMRQRVAIAAALARDPEILIADEPSTALDVTTQNEIVSLLQRLQKERAMGLVFITHDLRLAFSFCERIYVFYAGSVMEVGEADQLAAEPRHPYTQGLLLSEPPLDRRLERLVELEGSVPSPDSVASMCPFAPRCRWVKPRCRASAPHLESVTAGRQVACIRVHEIQAELHAERVQADRQAVAVARHVASSRVLEVMEVSKTFLTGSREVDALREVSLEISEGESVGLVGESGSGKTTLARCIVGLEQIDAGTIRLANLNVTRYAELTKGDLKTVRQSVQVIFQDPYSSLNPARSIGATLREALLVRGPRGRDLDGRVAELLGRVGLPSAYADRRPVGLSGGERQRVAIARAIAVEPRLIICDEPVSSLDVSVQAQILNLLADIRRDLGVAYLFITHDLTVVRQVADRVYVLYRGDLVEAGDVGAVLNAPEHSYTRRLIDSVPGTVRTDVPPSTPGAGVRGAQADTDGIYQLQGGSK